MKRATIFVIILSISTFLCSQCVIQLTDNDYDDWNPQIHNGQVVWSGDGQIHYWDGTSNIILTETLDNLSYSVKPRIHNGQVVWLSSENYGITHIVFLWDGNSITQLSDSQNNADFPNIHNGGGDHEKTHISNGSLISSNNISLFSRISDI